MRSIGLIICLLLTNIILAAQKPEPNDLSSFYGFGEMEIIKADWTIHSLQVADFDNDGRKDIAFVNDTKSEIELYLQKSKIEPAESEVAVSAEDADINTISEATRFKKQTVPVSQRIFSFACGDLNHDGLMDLAFYGDPKGLYVLLQKSPRQKKQRK